VHRNARIECSCNRTCCFPPMRSSNRITPRWPSPESSTCSTSLWLNVLTQCCRLRTTGEWVRDQYEYERGHLCDRWESVDGPGSITLILDGPGSTTLILDISASTEEKPRTSSSTMTIGERLRGRSNEPAWTRFPRTLFLVISHNRFRSPIVIVLELVLVLGLLFCLAGRGVVAQSPLVSPNTLILNLAETNGFDRRLYHEAQNFE
jgi:hypothetical protein